MKIIVVKGNQNTGKTTSIRLAYDIALYLGAAIITPRNIEDKPHNDFETVIFYNGKRIGFHSGGDLLKSFEEVIDDYKEKKCDTLVMASRNFKQIALDALFNGHEVVYLHKDKKDDIENVDIARNIVVNL